MSKGLFVFMLLMGLVACGPRDGLAPVVERKWVFFNPNATKHVVVRGETLFAVAFRYDEDYRTLAKLNQIKSPYTLHVGQVLHLTKKYNKSLRPSKSDKRAQVTSNISKASSLPRKARWDWPYHGKVVVGFSPKHGKKGINIAGKKGDKIRAAAPGVVAYAGNGLAGYGNLIIIKQGNHYLTAYGNNARNLVHEGQKIKQGQEIAVMGIVDRKYPGLHFEVRKMGQPVNPLRYLK